MENNQDIRHIVNLLDDPSQTVAKMVDEALFSRGEQVIDELKALWYEESDETLKKLILEKMSDVNSHFRLVQLKSYVDLAKDGEASLLEGAFLVSSLLTPGLGRSAFYSFFLPIIGEVMAETSELKTGVENVKILNHIFYHRFGFKAGDPFTLNDTNLLFNNVIETKTGNPVAISIFYFIIAQACGIPVYPMCFTGGFISVYTENNKPLFYLNLFHEGEIFLENNIETMLKGQQLPVDLGSFEIKKDATVLLIYLELLDGLYSMSGNKARQGITETALQCFGNDRFMTIEEEE